VIVIIQGPPKSGKTQLANSLRNAQISMKKGALLIDEDTQGEIKPLVEKILIGVELPPKENIPADLKELPWKPESMVILVGERADSALQALEDAVPGFTAFHGPVNRMNAGVQQS
jgi:hypothetical protein